MRRALPIALAVLVLLALAGWGVLQSQSFWRWGGWEVVDLARDRLYGDLKVGAVQGQPLTGFTFSDVTLSWSQGEIVHTDKLELRFSLWSFLRLRPVIANITLHEATITLRQDEQGRWELAGILKKRPPPPFDSLYFPEIRIRHGQVAVVRPGGIQRYEDLEANLDLIVLHPKRPDQEIQVRGAMLAATTPEGHLCFQASLTYAHEQLKVHTMKVSCGEQLLAELNGEGGLGPTQKSLFYINVGPISGTLMQQYFPKWAKDWDLKGKFRLGALGLSRFEISGPGQVQHAAFELNGLISRESGQWTYDLDIKLSNARAELLEPFNPQWAQKLKDLSPVAGRLTLKGAGLSWPPEQLDWSLDTTAFRDRQVSIEHIKIGLTGDARRQHLACQSRGNFGEVSLTAAGPLLTSFQGDLKVQAKDFQPSRLGLAKAGATSLSGKFSGAFSLPGGRGLTGLKLSGDLEARGRLGQEPLEDLRARLTGQQPKLEIAKASMRLRAVAAEFSGSLEGERLNAQVKGSLALVAAKSYLPAATNGRLEFSGALSGTLNAPRVALQGSGQGLTTDGISLKSFTFKANAAGWPPAAGDLEVRGTGLTAPAAAFPQASLSCRGEAGRWQLHLTAGGAPSGDKAEVLGSADLRARPVSMVLEKFSWRSKDYTIANTGPVQLRLIPGLQFASGAFKVTDGDLALNLEAQGPQLSGQVSLRNFPANLFNFEGPALQGKINGQLSLSGPPAAPLLRGQVSWGPGQVGEFPFRTAQSSFDYREGQLRLSGSLEEKNGGPRLVWDGQLPLNLSLNPWKCSLGNQNMALTVKGEGTNLALLTALPAVQSAQGAIDLMTQWGGDPHHPQVTGQVRWGESSLKLRATGLPYRLLPGEARLQGNKIAIPELTLESGPSGSLRLSGDLSLTGFTPGQVQMRGQATNFLAIRKEGTQVEANGNLALIGPVSQARLTGQILIPKATFATSFFTGGPHPDIILVNQPPPGAEPKSAATKLAFWKNLQVDLTLQSAGEVAVKNKDINVILQGSFKGLKAPGQDSLAFSGVMRAVKGTIDIQGRTFKVSEGTVTLSGQPHVPGVLAGRAVSESGEVTLFLDISGPTNKPVLRFSSNPPLPPQDVLSYLVFGRSAATLSREEFNTINQQAIGIFGGLTAGKLRDILGNEVPLLCDVSMRCGEQSVGVIKPLTEQLSVGFERKNNPLYRDDTNQARIEYRINKYVGVESTVGRRNTGGDVLFNYDF